MRGFAALAAAHERRVELETSIGRQAQTIVASDFVRGGRSDFARACSSGGNVIEVIRRLVDEPYEVFLERVRSAAVGLGAPRLIVGGVSDPAFNPNAVLGAPEAPQRGAILLPDGGGLHPGQVRAARTILDHPRVVLRAGRRFGKSALLICLAADEALRGRPVGYFSPLFKTAAPVFDALAFMLAPLIISKRRALEIKLSTGGIIDIWSIETSTIIGRGRKYALALLDEIAFCKENMGLLWRASISPTLVDLDGAAVVASTPWGTDVSNWFFQICSDKALGWIELHARTEDNPFLPRAALEEEKRRNSPIVWRQEFEAEFTSLDAAALIDVTKLLQSNGDPWPEPSYFDLAFVTIDSAIKTGAGADGTAALFCGVTGLHAERPQDRRLWFLDYEIVQVSAGVLEPWFSSVVQRARQIKAVRAGPIYVEDAATGPILLEKFPGVTEALSSVWLSEGKDLRAYAVQTYFNSGQIRITESCYSKIVSFKGIRLNHLWVQLNSFVLGDKEANKRADDLLDCAVYAASVAFRQPPVKKRAA
jgi:hypothetical protein